MPRTTLPSMQRRSPSGLPTRGGSSICWLFEHALIRNRDCGWRVVQVCYQQTSPNPDDQWEASCETGSSRARYVGGFVVALTGATIAEHHRIVDAGSAGDASVVHWRVASFSQGPSAPSANSRHRTGGRRRHGRRRGLCYAGLATATTSGSAIRSSWANGASYRVFRTFLRQRVKIIPASDVNVIEGAPRRSDRGEESWLYLRQGYPPRPR
jgi:hypothetical protein